MTPVRFVGSCFPILATNCLARMGYPAREADEALPNHNHEESGHDCLDSIGCAQILPLAFSVSYKV